MGSITLHVEREWIDKERGAQIVEHERATSAIPVEEMLSNIIELRDFTARRFQALK